MSMEDATHAIEARLPDFAGLNARIKFDMGDEGILVVDATSTTPAVSSDEPEDAHCTIRLTSENLEKLVTGKLNPTLAYAMGSLKIDGSMGIAMKLVALLDE